MCIKSQNKTLSYQDVLNSITQQCQSLSEQEEKSSLIFKADCSVKILVKKGKVFLQSALGMREYQSIKQAYDFATECAEIGII